MSGAESCFGLSAIRGLLKIHRTPAGDRCPNEIDGRLSRSRVCQEPSPRRQKPCSSRALLTRHRELESLLGADHVVDVLGRSVDVDLHPVYLAAELLAARTVVRLHGLTNVTAHFRGLVHGEEERMRAPDLPSANRLAVDEQHDSRALADAAPAVRELHAYLVLAARKRRAGRDAGVLHAEKVVEVLA